MHSLKLGCYLLFLWAAYIQAGDPRIPIWTKLTKTLDDPVKLEKALREDDLPTDDGSLLMISDFIQKHAPKSRTGSPCCLKKNVEIDPTLEKLIEFHIQQVALMKERRDSLSEDERGSLVSIERDVEKMPKKIRRSYEELPSLD